jgi:hypothetical protein
MFRNYRVAALEMHITHLLRRALALSLALLAPLCHADAPRALMWADLVPKLAAADNPFAKLDKEQLVQLTTIATVRDRKARGDTTLSALELADERALSRDLTKSGVDVDGLLAKRKQMAQQANAALDGQTIRIPGYLLPLEFSGKRVTEFLLVPWVGACIHTPPPPPNQIVYVKTAKPFEMSGVFQPIWVTGQLTAKAAKQSLYLVDGTSDISIGYTLQATVVEPYE